MRTRGRLRVVLNPKHRKIPVSQPLYGSVVEVDVGDLELFRSFHRTFVSLNCETVVLGCDQDSARFHLSHGVIPAPVTRRP